MLIMIYSRCIYTVKHIVLYLALEKRYITTSYYLLLLLIELNWFSLEIKLTDPTPLWYSHFREEASKLFWSMNIYTLA